MQGNAYVCLCLVDPATSLQAGIRLEAHRWLGLEVGRRVLCAYSNAYCVLVLTGITQLVSKSTTVSQASSAALSRDNKSWQ